MRAAAGVSPLSRRRLLAGAMSVAAASAAGGTWSLLSGCSRRIPPLRIATNVWPGNEFLHLAREQQYFGDEIRLVELPSATAILHALAAGTVEGASLTLDEVLSAVDSGLPLTIVTVLDESQGADVLLARPPIRSLADLRGRRVGAELSAVGAVVLEEALKAAGLAASDIVLVPVTVDAHEAAWASGDIDALITFEPVAGRLQAAGARRIFDTAQVPGRIIDVLAISSVALPGHTRAVRNLVAGHFRAREDFLRAPSSVAPIVARRLRMPPDEVPSAYVGLLLPGPAENRAWMRNPGGRLPLQVARLAGHLRRVGLLEGEVETVPAISDFYLPSELRP